LNGGTKDRENGERKPLRSTKKTKKKKIPRRGIKERKTSRSFTRDAAASEFFLGVHTTPQD